MSEQASAAPAANAAPGTAATPGTEISVPNATPTAPETPQYYEVKVNGQMRRYTLDELRSKAGLAEAAHEKMEQASQISKKEQSRRELMQKDFMQALMDPELGLSKDQIRTRFETWYHENFIEPETLSEAEKYKRELDRLKAEREQEVKDRETAKQREEDEAFDAQTRVQVQKDMIAAIEKFNLPRDRDTIRKMAFFMKQNLRRGYDAPMDVIAQQVKDDVYAGKRNFVKEASAEQIIEAFGPEIIKKLREYDLAQLRQRTNMPTAIKETAQGGGNERRRKTMSDVDAYFNELRRSK